MSEPKCPACGAALAGLSDDQGIKLFQCGSIQVTTDDGQSSIIQVDDCKKIMREDVERARAAQHRN